MGWGFAVIVDKTDKEKTINALEKADANPQQIGTVTNTQEIRITHENIRLLLK